jgi:predicted phosphoribosyltransferase
MHGGRFGDRVEAGRRLAEELSAYAGRADVLVLALPRGGVPVGFEVAQALDAPLDIFLVRKLGVPGHEELAMGAIASGGIRVLNDEVLAQVHVPPEAIDAAAQRELRELERRERAYRGDRPEPPIAGRTIIVVDDGLATGSTMRAAVAALRSQGPARLIVAVPVAARETRDAFRVLVDEIVCPLTPDPFYAVGMWYNDFSQTTDEEVSALLSIARQRHADPAALEAR